MVTEPLPKQHSTDPPIARASIDDAYLNIVTYNKNALNNLRRAVVLGQGQFSLILARANYQHLQGVLLDELVSELGAHLRLKRIALPPSATRLRDAILTQIADSAKMLDRRTDYQALMVTGLECIQSAEQLAALLKAANLGRDELPKTFDTPVVLWVNDAILQQLNKFAPDLKSFAATPVRFDYPLDTLTMMLKAQADDVFRHAVGFEDGTVASECFTQDSNTTDSEKEDQTIDKAKEDKREKQIYQIESQTEVQTESQIEAQTETQTDRGPS